jgi:PAS domain S-box-containing protein
MTLVDEHFRLLVESIQDYAIYLLDPSGIVRSWNAGAQRLKGYTADEVIGRPFATFFTPEDRASAKPDHLLAAALQQGRHEDDGWRVRKDGSQFWANAVITALFADGKHVGFAKVTRDLTERAYRAFVEATHAIVWGTDASGRPNADSPTWREFTGQTAEQWRSGGAAECVHPDDRVLLEERWATAKATGIPLDVEFRLRRQDGKYVWMGARAVPFRNADATIREWFGVTSDISDRKLAQLERERALDLLRTTLRSIGDAVIATDPKGLVTFMNPIAEQLTGWSTDEARGRGLREIFPIFNEETGAAVENPVDKVLREGVVVGLGNHTVLRRRDGSQSPIDDSAAPIRSDAGVLEGVVLVFRDASEEKREYYRRMFLARASEEIAAAGDYRDALRRIAKLACPRMADSVSVDIVDPATGQAPTRASNVIRTGRSELVDRGSAMVVPLRGQRDVFGAITFIFSGEGRRYTEEDVQLAEELSKRVSLMIERRRLEEQAELANRMKDEFLATVSHELRTPLQAILGYGSMLQQKIATDPDRAIAVIMRNAEAQARLIDDLLDVSRILSGKLRLTMAHIDVAGAITAAVDSVRPTASARHQQLSVDIRDDLGFVFGDFERLQQVVWNLLTNAIKFTPRGGTISVRAARIGSTVRIAIADTGKGIPPEALSTVFDRFRQADSSSTRTHGGLGLGLAIVKYLIEAHGGTVTAESPGVDRGATFTVILPTQLEPLTHGTVARPVVALSNALSGVRVLLVDDDDDSRQFVADALTAAGARIDQAASVAEALQRLQEGRPDVLISDIAMPHEDGYALLRRVRALEGGDVPAIALTAYARPEDVAKAHQSGFRLHLAKPVTLEQLIEAIKSCLP